MKQLLRIALMVLILVALTVAGIVAAVRLALPPAKVIAYLKDASLGYAGRALEIKELSYGVRGMSLRGVAISNPPGFVSGTFLSFDRLHVGVAFHPLRAVVSGTAGELAFTGELRRGPGGRGIRIDTMRLTAGGGELAVAGTVDNFRQPENLRYAVTLAGDRRVLDAVLALFPALANVQIGDTPRIALSISGDARDMKITRLP